MEGEEDRPEVNNYYLEERITQFEKIKVERG